MESLDKSDMDFLKRPAQGPNGAALLYCVGENKIVTKREKLIPARFARRQAG